MKTSILSTILCLTLVTLCGWRCATARAADDATDLELRSLLAGEAIRPGQPEAPPVVAKQVRTGGGNTQDGRGVECRSDQRPDRVDC